MHHLEHMNGNYLAGAALVAQNGDIFVGAHLWTTWQEGPSWHRTRTSSLARAPSLSLGPCAVTCTPMDYLVEGGPRGAERGHLRWPVRRHFRSAHAPSLAHLWTTWWEGALVAQNAVTFARPMRRHFRSARAPSLSLGPCAVTFARPVRRHFRSARARSLSLWNTI